MLFAKKNFSVLSKDLVMQQKPGERNEIIGVILTNPNRKCWEGKITVLILE